MNDQLGELWQNILVKLGLHLNIAGCIFWTHSPPIVTRLYWSGRGESCGRLFVQPITARLCPTEPSHWTKCLASGLFCRIFYQNIGNGHRHVPSNVGWLGQVEAVTSDPFRRLEVTLEWGVKILKWLTLQTLFRTGARGQLMGGMWGWEWIMFPNQQGRAEANWGSVAGKSSNFNICSTRKNLTIYIFDLSKDCTVYQWYTVIHCITQLLRLSPDWTLIITFKLLSVKREHTKHHLVVGLNLRSQKLAHLNRLLWSKNPIYDSSTKFHTSISKVLSMFPRTFQFSFIFSCHPSHIVFSTARCSSWTRLLSRIPSIHPSHPIHPIPSTHL